MPFIIGAVAAAGSLASSLATSSSQSGAVASGKAQANAAAQGALDSATTTLRPYTDAGAAATTRASDLLGLNGTGANDAAVAAFRSTPGYDFARSEGLAAVDAGAASRGTVRSGNTVAAETAFGSGLADQTFGQYYSRLNALLQTGAQAAGTVAGADIATGHEIAGTDASAATAQASIYGQQGAALQQGFGNAYGSANALFGAGAGAAGTPAIKAAPSGLSALLGNNSYDTFPVS